MLVSLEISDVLPSHHFGDSSIIMNFFLLVGIWKYNEVFREPCFRICQISRILKRDLETSYKQQYVYTGIKLNYASAVK